ncbi:DUF3445 domain-containing protein [Nitrospirillum sp. BR 11752]|uniref:heme-dependent oxidative N-demethylase family protein n=1 Tax=Nitrospirillum sp. BR 11752 TaxID=3104293 RepID=UPI002E9AA00E|nr:DUF3445 domain-containing protein [Nitrospirillum sp. BR 11752]
MAAWTLPPEQPCWPFDGGDWRMAMGLMALNPARWLMVDDSCPALLAERRALLAQRHGAVTGFLPGSHDAQAEVLALMADHLPRHFPGAYVREGRRLTCRLTGEVWDLDAAGPNPLEVAGRLVAEDLCLLLPDAAGLPVLAAAVLCFPNRWRLREKLGRPMAGIHAPVALYGEKLGRPVDRFLETLAPDRPVWRMNWGLNDDPALFQPEEVAHTAADAALTPENAGHRLFLRIERQTLRRLPATGAILFTIRTYQRALGDLTGEEAAQLAHVLRTVPKPVARYKGLPRTAGPALGFLDRRVYAPSTS